MQIEEFNFPTLPRGFKERFYLEIPLSPTERLSSYSIFALTSHDTLDIQRMEALVSHEIDNERHVIRLPVVVVNGASDGPTLVAFAGVKGDEYEGMRAITEVYHLLDPSQMKGNFIGVPVVNVPAFWSATRVSPVDFKNLARTYPGRPNGSVSERIAYHSLEKILSHATLFIDLHSGGRHTFLPRLCGYYNDGAELGRVSRGAAISFGAPVVWEHEILSPGRTIYEAVKKGIPALYTECRGGGHLDEEDTQCFTRGLCNLLQYLKVIPGDPVLPPGQRMLGGAGDVDVAVSIQQGGIFRSRVKLLDQVVEGQLLGEVTNLVGDVIEEVRANTSGIIELVRSTPRVFPGETIYLISSELF